MGRFLYNCLLFLIVELSLFFLMSFIVKPKNIIINDYMAAMIDKHERINKINRPKIIFAGGSNLAFGLNSNEIETEFSVPVVNLGLHAGLGLDFMLNELKNSIKTNDIVFLSIEYFLDSNGDYELKKYTASFYKDAYKYYNFNLKKEISIYIEDTRLNIKKYSLKKIKVPNSNQEILIYSRKSFNKYGDHIAHIGMEQPKELADRSVFKYLYWDGIDKLNKFYNYAKSKNVTVFFIYPNYPLSEFNKNKDVINKLANDLSYNLYIEILNKPIDFVFSDSLFFDTVYHLNKNGRELRTKKLIKIIKNSKSAQQAISSIHL